MTKQLVKIAALAFSLGMALMTGCKSSTPTPASSPAPAVSAPAPAAPANATPAPAAAATAKPDKGLGHPYTKQHLYNESADPMTSISAGLKQARAEHKRVILDFGGDWCGDCQVLDIYFHDPANWPIVQKHFVIVHIFIGHMDKNLELAASYGVPIHKGVPALAVLSANGTLLYSQKTGEFNDMRHMDVASLTKFLNTWKG